MEHNEYTNPLITRYATKEMSFIFSDDNRYSLWRKLWIALAECEKELGLNITDEQIFEMKENINNIDYDYVKEREKILRHDVMAHIDAYSKVAPKAAPIIHLGATSCFVTDNSDILIYKEGLELIKKKLVALMYKLTTFSQKYKKLPTLGYTHLQPAQLVTVGKRATLWLQDFLYDFNSLNEFTATIRLRGVKGTTGTQASFMELFDGDSKKIRMLDKNVAIKMGMDKVYAVSGQTYPRKLDYSILTRLSEISQSAYKLCNDLRILQNRKEIEEPFETTQVGSSAMAYKRNPMRSERVCSLSRYVMSLPINASMTASTQWLERTLDDSANRRIVMGQGFLAVDAILELLLNICDGLVVYPKVIRKHINEELPFMATEAILMEGVKAGGNRQELHERIRVHSMAAAKRVKEEGKDNDLIKRLKDDPCFSTIATDISKILKPESFIGRAPQQVDEFIKEEVNPVLKKYPESCNLSGDIKL